MMFSGYLPILLPILLFLGQEPPGVNGCDDECRTAIVRELKTFFLIDMQLMTAGSFRIALDNFKAEILEKIATQPIHAQGTPQDQQSSDGNIQAELELISTTLKSVSKQINKIEMKMSSIDQQASTENCVNESRIVEPINEKLKSLNGISQEINIIRNNTESTEAVIEEIKQVIKPLNDSELQKNITEISDQVNSIESTTETTNDIQCIQSNLTWYSVGSDRFALFSEEKSWEAAREVCRSHCLDLYVPKDAFKLATYIEYNIRATNYHLGGRGTGSRRISPGHQRWVTGELISYSQPWLPGHYERVDIGMCLFLVARGDYPVKGKVLGAYYCTESRPFLCGNTAR